MIRSYVPWLLVVALATPSAVLAENEPPVATGRTEAPPPAGERAPDLPEGTAPTPTASESAPDRRPHGAVSVSVGTGGYREVAGVVTVPVGETGEATAAVIYSEHGSSGRRRGGRR